jgi:hypothetical protein
MVGLFCAFISCLRIQPIKANIRPERRKVFRSEWNAPIPETKTEDRTIAAPADGRLAERPNPTFQTL